MIMTVDLNINPLTNWLTDKKIPLVIAGPCSAESEEQMLATARELVKNQKISYFRAGIWKPRTRPGSFEGMGVEALRWRQAVKEETGLKVATEVANTDHVEVCLEHGVDLLWIGARTSVNPFSVQEIANALKGVDVPVAVKNPINPDLQLWVGALERINKAGIDHLIAIHRGFSSFEKSPFRNQPLWEFPIELKSICPDVPILCDPSHIAGTRDLIPFISQKALDMDMDGFMIESHINPMAALSDADQQLTPNALDDLLNDLIVRLATTRNEEFKTQLDDLRRLIDDLDEEITQKLSARMDVAEKIGEYKKENNVTILQVKRWEELISDRLSTATAMGLSEDFMRGVLKLVHKESIRRQTEVMNNQKV